MAIRPAIRLPSRSSSGMRTTWDGLPISEEPPFGATVVVFRNRGTTVEVLLLHRAHHGPEYAGDWAWTPPAGSRLPGEPIDHCARRELREETGLDLPPILTDCGTADWPHYLARAPRDAAVALDAEHDRFEWVAADQAPARCLPDLTRLPLEAAIQRIPKPVALESARATRLLLIRHGEGRVNVERVLGGLRGCTGLTDLGRQQVSILSDRWAQRGFPVDALLSSPVRRARESADILSRGLHVSVREDCALCELHLGEADGLSWTEYETRFGRTFDLMGQPERPYAPGAESWNQVVQRVRHCLDGFAATHAEQTVAIVSHAGFIVASMLELLAIPVTARRAYLDPAFTSITCWQYEAGHWTLIVFNDTHHLDGTHWLRAQG